MQSICFKCENPTKSGKTVFVYDKEVRALITVCRDCKIKYYNKEVRK